LTPVYAHGLKAVVSGILLLGAVGEKKKANANTKVCYDQQDKTFPELQQCPRFGWGSVNFPPRSCCILDLVQEEC